MFCRVMDVVAFQTEVPDDDVKLRIGFGMSEMRIVVDRRTAGKEVNPVRLATLESFLISGQRVVYENLITVDGH